MNILIDYDIPKQYLPMDSFFRGLHQLIEINLIFILNNHKDIKKIINNDITCARQLIYKNINIWLELTQLLNILATLDEYDYQHYRNLIYGTSGGESINSTKPTFVNHVFNFDNDTKNELLNTLCPNKLNIRKKNYIVKFSYYHGINYFILI